jgi:hypothetical protein
VSLTDHRLEARTQIVELTTAQHKSEAIYRIERLALDLTAFASGQFEGKFETYATSVDVLLSVKLHGAFCRHISEGTNRN